MEKRDICDDSYLVSEDNYKYLISYKPAENTYNKVLFIMKEPDAGSDAGKTEKLKAIWRNNREWFLKRIAGTDKKARTDSMYRNRFTEMLKAINCSDCKLDKCAYANINPLGGGTSESKIFKNLISHKEEVSKRIKYIIDETNPKIVFTCSAIYRIIKEQNSKKDGLPYNSKKNYKAFCVDDVKFYEIHHPIFSPRINT